MIKIDNSLLEEIGLGTLPAHEKDSLLKHIYETLEMRVGMRLADQMTNQQLDEFEQYFAAKDDAGAFRWLETNFPNYKDVVQEEFDKLKNEVRAAAPQILASAQAAQSQQSQPGVGPSNQPLTSPPAYQQPTPPQPMPSGQWGATPPPPGFQAPPQGATPPAPDMPLAPAGGPQPTLPPAQPQQPPQAPFLQPPPYDDNTGAAAQPPAGSGYQQP